MPRFFVENIDKNHPVISGGDADHIKRSLRMKIGEGLTVCDTAGKDYICEISDFGECEVYLKIIEERESDSEPSVKVTLFQCVPKGDKLESVIQKSVELGVNSIVPVLSSRCISRPDPKSAKKKQERYQKIADSAAKQSGRGILPQIEEMISFDKMCERFVEFDKIIFFYEGGGASLREIIIDSIKTAAIVIGPEGGFDIAEVEKATENGAEKCGLGKRILRTETAPLAALSALMLLSGNLE